MNASCVFRLARVSIVYCFKWIVVAVKPNPSKRMYYCLFIFFLHIKLAVSTSYFNSFLTIVLKTDALLMTFWEGGSVLNLEIIDTYSLYEKMVT